MRRGDLDGAVHLARDQTAIDLACIGFLDQAPVLAAVDVTKMITTSWVVDGRAFSRMSFRTSRRMAQAEIVQQRLHDCRMARIADCPAG